MPPLQIIVLVALTAVVALAAVLIAVRRHRRRRDEEAAMRAVEAPLPQLTQDDIASLAGTSRPTANRVLKAAEDDGVLSVRRGRIEVLDATALEQRAR